MDTKFSSDYWSHPQVEAAPLEVKLAGAWMRTNDRLTLCGYAAVTPQRFAFETGLPETWFSRAIEALNEWFIRAPRGYFVPGYIGEQIGRGDSLLANNMCKGLLRGLAALHDHIISALVVAAYPELEDAIKVTSNLNPLSSPPGGVREERRGVRVGGAGGREFEAPILALEPVPAAPAPRARTRKPAPGSRLPAEQPEPTRSRMLALNAIFRREPTTAWSAADVRALEDSDLLRVAELDFVETCETVRAFYGAKISRDSAPQFWRRTTLQTLLNNWAGELDKARAWARDRSDGLTKL